MSETEGLRENRRRAERGGSVCTRSVRSARCRKGLRFGTAAGRKCFAVSEPMHRCLYLLDESIHVYVYICVIATQLRMLAVIFRRFRPLVRFCRIFTEIAEPVTNARSPIFFIRILFSNVHRIFYRSRSFKHVRSQSARTPSDFFLTRAPGVIRRSDNN